MDAALTLAPLHRLDRSSQVCNIIVRLFDAVFILGAPRFHSRISISKQIPGSEEYLTAAQSIDARALSSDTLRDVIILSRCGGRDSLRTIGLSDGTSSLAKIHHSYLNAQVAKRTGIQRCSHMNALILGWFYIRYSFLFSQPSSLHIDNHGPGTRQALQHKDHHSYVGPYTCGDSKSSRHMGLLRGETSRSWESLKIQCIRKHARGS